MSLKKCRYLIYALLILSNAQAQDEVASHLITLFIKLYPDKPISTLEISEAVELCRLLNCNIAKILPNFGIFALYSGYMNISDENGQINFPRKTLKNAFDLVITEKISPVFMFRNTIAFWQISPDSPVKMYKVERKQDRTTELYYWEVTEKKVPISKKISLHSIVILSDPDDIYVPIGITMTNNNPQLILPPIYAKSTVKNIQHSLFVLNIKPLFAQVKKLFKERPLGYMYQIKA